MRPSGDRRSQSGATHPPPPPVPPSSDHHEGRASSGVHPSLLADIQRRGEVSHRPPPPPHAPPSLSEHKPEALGSHASALGHQKNDPHSSSSENFLAGIARHRKDPVVVHKEENLPTFATNCMLREAEDTADSPKVCPSSFSLFINCLLASYFCYSLLCLRQSMEPRSYLR